MLRLACHPLRAQVLRYSPQVLTSGTHNPSPMTGEEEGIKTFEDISRMDHSASARTIFVLLEHCGERRSVRSAM